MRQSETRLSLTSANGHSSPTRQSPAPNLPADTLRFLILSLKKQWKRYRKELNKCQRHFSERSVHDLRIAARRLLSLLDLLASFMTAGRLKKAQAALKCHLDTFDDLRDTQVQLPAVRRFRQSLVAAECFYCFLKKREKRLRASTCEKARKLRCKPLRKLLRDLRDDVKQWAADAPPARCNRLLLAAVERAFSLTSRRKDRIRPDDTHSIHCTRVAFKKFRYVVEALKARVPGVDDALLAKMRRYQKWMGDIQDSEVLLRGLQKFIRKKQPDQKSSRKFEGLLQERRRRLIARYLVSANQLFEFWPPAETHSKADSGNGKSRRPAAHGSSA